MLQPRQARELCFGKRFAFLSSCRYNGCRERKKEMNKTRVAVKAVIVCNGCFLLLERRQNGEEGIYDLPGGGVETGESHTQALTREIFEETGLTVQNQTPAQNLEFFSPGGGNALRRHFPCRIPLRHGQTFRRARKLAMVSFQPHGRCRPASLDPRRKRPGGGSR